MKTNVALFVSVLLLAACSAPKYTYHFDHYDYNSGKKKNLEAKQVDQVGLANVENPESPIAVQNEDMVASASSGIVTPEEKSVVPASFATGKKYKEMTKAEKKAFRKDLKSEIRKYAKAKKSGDLKSVEDTKAMDYNLKMAIIFGAVALTLSFFGGVNSVFWVASVICLVVGVVFFIKWIAEQ